MSGLVAVEHLKPNNTARAGDLLFLTKPLGVGILTTAEKRGLLRDEDAGRAAQQMTRLNHVGEALGRLPAVHAMTDVTGFGLLGHLGELCEGSRLRAEISFAAVPQLPNLAYYLKHRSTPGGTARNWASYSNAIGRLTDDQRTLLCDPQTSGGLLVAAAPNSLGEIQAAFDQHGLRDFATPIGRLLPPDDTQPLITVQ